MVFEDDNAGRLAGVWRSLVIIPAFRSVPFLRRRGAVVTGNKVMPHKQVLFRSEAQEKVVKGAALLADMIRKTLDPKSQSVLIRQMACNDGITIAKEFTLKDADDNVGAPMLRQAAKKTGDAIRDGTSTSTILAHTIPSEAR